MIRNKASQRRGHPIAARQRQIQVPTLQALVVRVVWVVVFGGAGLGLFGARDGCDARLEGQRWALAFGGVLCSALAMLAAFRDPLKTVRAAAVALGHAIRETLASMIQDLRALPRSQKALLVALTLTGALLRVVRGFHPIQYDEAYTGFFFVAGGIDKAFVYTYPNNHVLHTLCAKGVTGVLGLAPFPLRLVSILCGTLSVPLIFLAARRALAGSGVWAALGVAVWPALVLMDAQARGYSMTHLLAAALLYVAALWLRSGSHGHAMLFGALAALSLFAVPTALFSVAAIGLWAVFVHGLERRGTPVDTVAFALVSGSVAVVLAAGLYLPVILKNNGTGALLNNPFVEPQPWRAFLAAVPPHLVAVLKDFSQGIFPGAAGVVVLTALLGTLCLRLRRSLLLLAAWLAAAVVVLLGVHHTPYERTWLYSGLLVAASCDAMVTELMRRGTRRSARWLAAVLGVCTACVGLGVLVRALPMALRPDPVKTVAQWIAARSAQDDVFFGDSWTHERLMYYFAALDERCRPLGNAPRGRVFYVINATDVEKPYLKIQLQGVRPACEIDGLRVYVLNTR